ncbi:MAG: LPS export ABC transporter permease LptG [Bdellovibrionales bacterium]
MNRIDIYTSKVFWGAFIGALLVFATMFVAVDALGTLVKFSGTPFTSVVAYYLMYLPEVISKMIPVACVVALVLTLSSMNRTSELIALYAAGMGLLRIAAPLLLWISVISIGTFLMGDQVLPQMIKRKNFIYYNEIEKNPSKFQFVRTDRIWYRSKNSIFNIKTLSPEGDKAQGLTLYFFSEDWNLLQMLTAQEVFFRGNQWELMKGSITIFDSTSSFPLTSNFDRKTIIMSEESKDLQSTGQTSDMLSQRELSRFIDRNREAGLETSRYEMDYHAKFGFAWAGFVMALLGLPFTAQRGRSGGSMVSLGMCLGVVFMYWILYSSSQALGTHGVLPPVIAAWLPNFLMAALAFWTLRKRGF